MANNIIGSTETAIIWGLESGFGSKSINEARDKWFGLHKSFVVKQDINKRLAFITLEAFLMNDLDNEPENLSQYWVTTPAKLIEKSDDGSYRCYETESGTYYHIYKKGTIEKP